MQKYTLNVEKSKEVYEYFSDRIAVKECYNNIFNIAALSRSTFHNGKWKVAYGYMSSIENLLCRHCFIIDENGNVIDPTIFAAEKPYIEREYFTMKIYENRDMYFEAIEAAEYSPALDTQLSAESKQAQAWAKDNGYILVG